MVVPDGGIKALSGLHSPPVVSSQHPGPASADAAGQAWIGHGTLLYFAGWRLSPYPAYGPVLCRSCGIRDITQKINRERNLPGINIEAVALLNIVRAGEFTVRAVISVAPLSVASERKIPDGGAWCLIRPQKRQNHALTSNAVAH